MNLSNLKVQQSISEDSDNNYIYAPIPTKNFCFITMPMEMNFSGEFKDLSQVYKKLLSEYNFSVMCEVMIKRSLCYSAISREFKQYPLEKIMNLIIHEMMLNELEIAAFSIYLNRFLWPDSPKSLVIMLYVIALAVKKYFNSDLEVICAYIDLKIPNILAFYNNWAYKNESLTWISIPELNKVYEELSRLPYECLPVEYNYYVDSILESAPASVYEKPIWIENLKVNVADIDGIGEPPVLAKLDSIFDPNYKELPRFETMLSTSSNTGIDFAWFDRDILRF